MAWDAVNSNPDFTVDGDTITLTTDGDANYEGALHEIAMTPDNGRSKVYWECELIGSALGGMTLGIAPSTLDVDSSEAWVALGSPVAGAENTVAVMNNVSWRGISVYVDGTWHAYYFAYNAIWTLAAGDILCICLDLTRFNGGIWVGVNGEWVAGWDPTGPGNEFDAYEDFTSWTEVDPNSDFTVAAGSIVGYSRRSQHSYLYKDVSDTPLDSAFLHQFEITNDDVYYGFMAYWMVSNAVGSIDEIDTAIYIYVSDQRTYGLAYKEGGTVQVSDTFNGSETANYWIEVTYDPDGGSGGYGQVTAEFRQYGPNGNTSGTLSIDLPATAPDSFDTIEMMVSGYNGGSGRVETTIADLSLNAAKPMAMDLLDGATEYYPALTAYSVGQGSEAVTVDFNYTVPDGFSALGAVVLDETYIAAPENVAASDGTYTNRVLVTWDANASATAYEVWRATSDDSALAEKQGADVVDAFYSDPYVEAGATYYYWVKAKNTTALSEFSAGDSGYVLSAVDLDASSVSAERLGLLGQWNFSDWKFLTKSTGDIMVDPVQEGVDYFCKLRSVSIFGKKQPFDAAYTVHRRIIGRLETYPPDLTGLTAVPNGDTVSIFADALTDPDIDGYEVRLGGSWEGGIFIAYSKAPNVRLVGVRPGVHTWWMAAKNNAGNYSLNPVNTSCRVFIPAGYSPYGIDPAETFDYATGTFDNTERIITPPASTANPMLMVSHEDDVLTGTWVSAEHDLGSAIQCRVWGDFNTQFATESMYWDNVIPDPTTWLDVAANARTWAEIIGMSNIQRAGRLRATLYHRVLPTDPWYEVNYFEILCAEVEARYLRVGVEITDPGLEAHLYLQALNLSVYVW